MPKQEQPCCLCRGVLKKVDLCTLVRECPAKKGETYGEELKRLKEENPEAYRDRTLFLLSLIPEDLGCTQ